MQRMVKYSVPVFVLAVGIFGAVRVFIWEECSLDNMIFAICALCACFLSGMLFMAFYKQEKKEKI